MIENDHEILMTILQDIKSFQDVQLLIIALNNYNQETYISPLFLGVYLAKR
jgi:hypothetical protein